MCLGCLVVLQICTTQPAFLAIFNLYWSALLTWITAIDSLVSLDGSIGIFGSLDGSIEIDQNSVLKTFSLGIGFGSETTGCEL